MILTFMSKGYAQKEALHINDSSDLIKRATGIAPPWHIRVNLIQFVSRRERTSARMDRALSFMAFGYPHRL